MVQVQVVERLAYIVEIKRCLALAKHLQDDVSFEIQVEVCDVGIGWSRQHVNVRTRDSIDDLAVSHSLHLSSPPIVNFLVMEGESACFPPIRLLDAAHD